MSGPVHGVDGAELIKYDWNENTGVASLAYRVPTDSGTKATSTKVRCEPCEPRHFGWADRHK